MIKEDETFARVNHQGLVEIIHTKTGKVIAVQRSVNKFDLMSTSTDDSPYLEIEDDEGNKVLVHRSINDPSSITGNTRYKYSKYVGDIICQKIAEGGVLKDICAQAGMPPISIIYRWMRENQPFHAAVQEAREVRAESFADEIYKIAQMSTSGVVDKDNIAGLKLATDAYKWLAEKNGKQSYGASKNAEGKGEMSVQIVVNTGIVRDNDDIVEVRTNE